MKFPAIAILRQSVPDETRLRYLRFILCFGFAAGFWVSRPLWLGDRAYPLTPVIGPLALRAPFDCALYGVAYALLAAIAFLRVRLIVSIGAFLAVALLLALGDQSRWHPWFYWDTFLMGAVWMAARSPLNASAALHCGRVLMIGSYFFAGAQKVGVTFYQNLFPWVLSAFFKSPETHPILSNAGFAVPIVEMATGFLLLAPRTRNLGVLAAVGTHLVILVFLGPFGHAVNANVWPWNATLVALVLVLFANSSETSAREIAFPRVPLHYAAVALFWILPVLTFFDLWDAYPGFSLYSGSQRAAYVQMDAVARAALPADLAPYADETNRIRITRWSMGEVKTPEYAEPRIYTNLLAYVCSRMAEIPGAPEGLELVVMKKPSRLTGERGVDFIAHCPK